MLLQKMFKPITERGRHENSKLNAQRVWMHKLSEMKRRFIRIIVQVAKIDDDAAILGSLNVAGVRLTIRQGRIEGSSGDINAGDVALTKFGN